MAERKRYLTDEQVAKIRKNAILANPAVPYKTKPRKLETNREWRRVNSDRVREQKRASYRRHAEHAKAKAHDWYHANKDRAYLTNVKNKFGLDPEDYLKMFEEQESKCFICQKVPTGKKRLGVDHCHKTGQVRRLLCMQCNTVVGLLYENPETARRLTEYITEHQVKQTEELNV